MTMLLPNLPYLLLGLGIVLMVIWNIILELRIKKLLGGENAKSLESTIVRNQERITGIETDNARIHQYIKNLDGRMKRKIDGVKTLRFNPFQGTGSGGNQSFASAFLDEEGNGVVLSSLYSRERLSIFAKPVIKRNSEYELTGEEKAVLEKNP